MLKHKASNALIVFLVLGMLFETIGFANGQSMGFQEEKRPQFGANEPLGGLEEPYDLFRRFSGNETPIWVEDEEMPSGAVKPFAAWLPSHPDRQGSANFAKDPCNQQTENGNIDDVVYWFDVGTNYDEDQVRIYAKDATAILLLFAKVFSLYEDFDIWNLNINDLGIKPVDIGFTYGFQQDHSQIGPAKLGLCVDSNVIAKVREMVLDKALEKMSEEAKKQKDNTDFNLNNPEFVETVLTDAAFEVAVAVLTGGLGKFLKIIDLSMFRKILEKVFKVGKNGVGDKIFNFGFDQIENKIKSTIVKPFVRDFMDAVKADEQLAKLPIDEAVLKWGENSNQFVVDILKDGFYVEHEDPLHRLNTTLNVRGQKPVINWSGNQGDASHVMILRINKSVKDSGGNYLREYAMVDYGTGAFTDSSLTCGNSYVYWISASNNKQFNKPDYPLPGHGDWTRVTAVSKDYVHCGNNFDQSGGSNPSVPTCSVPKTSKPIVFVQKLSGGGEKCVLVTDSVSDLSVLGLSAVDDVYLNDTEKFSEVQLFPQIGYTGGLPHVVTGVATNLATNPSGYSNKFKSARLESREYKCDGKPGIYTKFNDGSCMYVTASVKLSNTPYKGKNVSKVWAVGEFWGKWHENEDKSGANLEFSSSTKETDGKRYYAYLEVKTFNKCDRGQLESMGYAYGNSEPSWNGNCIVLGKPGDRVSLAEGTIRVLRSPGNPVYCWKDQDYRNNDGTSHAEYGNTPGKDYVIQDNRRSCLVVRKNNAPNPVIPHKEHGQQYADDTPIDLCFNSGGDPDNDALTFLVQIYHPYNPSVYFGSQLIESAMLTDAGCYRVKANLPPGGYGYNIHAYDNLPYEAKQSPGMWGTFRRTDSATPVVTDATPNGTPVSKMPLICSDWVWKNYGTARFNLWRFDPNGWVGIGFNLWQPDRCWSPDQFGFNEPGTYQWEAVGKNSLNQTFNSGVYHTFVVAGNDPIKPANGSIHNGYVPQVCWPSMGTTVSAVLPTTKAAYAVNVSKDGYSYGDYPWVSGTCYQLPNLGNGTYTVQVDLNLWNNTYQAGSWKRSFTVTGMSDPITPQIGVTLTSMPTLCQPQQGAWVIKYFFYLYTNNVYAGATPQSASTCWTPSYSFMNGNYRVVPAIVAWNGKIVTMPNFARNFVLNNTARSGGGEQEVLDLTPPVGDILEAELLAIQGVIPTVSLYLPLVVTDASTSVEIPQSEEQIQQNVVVEEKQPEDAKAIEQSAMTVQIFLPIVAK